MSKHKEMRKIWRYLVAIIFLLVIAVLLSLVINSFFEKIKSRSMPTENQSIKPEVYFCPEENCMEKLISQFDSAKKIDCAFYDLDLIPLINVLKKTDAELRIVMDDENYDGNEEKFETFSSKIKVDIANHQMHNKFCVFDGKVVATGSMNPTGNDNYKNNNNLLIIHSTYLAKNYEEEFVELWNGVYSTGGKVGYPEINLNGNVIENYFCPEDCSPKIYTDVMEMAKESIYFMTFSFTQDEIGSSIIEAHNRGIDVFGIFDTSQYNSQKEYSEYDRMLENNISVRLDNSSGKLHHKVFIIDKKIVITGSANPSNNGLYENDENILILHDERIAEEYVLEFDRLMNSEKK
jgi:phosphatidylserine/phosphatidylglycerophosphate/cardiolipin synthase-like enzyme